MGSVVGSAGETRSDRPVYGAMAGRSEAIGCLICLITLQTGISASVPKSRD